MKHVIMKGFTMKHFNIDADENGLLYNVQVWQQLAAHVAPDAMPALEAFSALVFAAKLMHRTMDAWAERFGLSATRLGILFMLRHQPEGVPGSQRRVARRPTPSGSRPSGSSEIYSTASATGS